MSRNGSGVYSLPAGSTVTNGDTSDATDINTPLTDLETDMNTPRPVVAGGTGAATAADARTNLGLAIGTNVQAFDADLSAVAGLSSNGLIARTGAGTAAARTITAGSAITITNGDGVSGNPTIAVSGLTTTQVDATTLVDSTDTIASNLSNTKWPTTQAVDDYIPAKLNASGSAPIYACRAWVNFNGTGTVAIRNDGNVASITDNGSGDFTVNLTTAMPDVNYSVVAQLTGDHAAGSATENMRIVSMTTSSVRFLCTYSNNSVGGVFDPSICCVSIFR